MTSHCAHGKMVRLCHIGYWDITRKATKLITAFLAKNGIYYRLYNRIQASETLSVEDEKTDYTEPRLPTAPDSLEQFVVLWPHAPTSSSFPTT